LPEFITDHARPYVYNVHAHDLEGLKTAIETALNHPIDSFIPEYMQFDFVVRKMGEVIEMDWKAKAEALLAERLAVGEGAVSPILDSAARLLLIS
jgi:hypothetical protein